MILGLAELIAQLAKVPPQSCWPVVRCLLRAGLTRQEGYDLAISLLPGLPLPLLPKGDMVFMIAHCQHPASNTRVHPCPQETLPPTHP